MDRKPAVGDWVTWRSQAGGSWKVKTGEVIYSGVKVFSPGHNLLPVELRKEVYAAPSRVMFDSVSDGVIVRVEASGRKPRYYSPRLSKLELVRGGKR
jgi:hypothetical protein